MSNSRIAIVGAGSWGTALACALSPGGETYMWSRDPTQVAAMQVKGRNPRYLSDIDLPPKVSFTADLADVVYQVPIVIMAVPAKAMLTTTRASHAVSEGRSSSSQAPIPGLCRPTLLSIPAVTWWTRGGGLPG